MNTAPKIKSGQSHFDTRIDSTSTWLFSKIFHHWIRNLDSPTPKHSELLESHHGDLRLEEHLYPYSIGANLDRRKAPELVTFSADVSIYLTCMPYQYLNTPWLWGQPTYMAHNDLYLINVIILSNNILFGRELFKD